MKKSMVIFAIIMTVAVRAASSSAGLVVPFDAVSDQRSFDAAFTHLGQEMQIHGRVAVQVVDTRGGTYAHVVASSHRNSKWAARIIEKLVYAYGLQVGCLTKEISPVAFAVLFNNKGAISGLLAHGARVGRSGMAYTVPRLASCNSMSNVSSTIEGHIDALIGKDLCHADDQAYVQAYRACLVLQKRRMLGRQGLTFAAWMVIAHNKLACDPLPSMVVEQLKDNPFLAPVDDVMEIHKTPATFENRARKFYHV